MQRREFIALVRGAAAAAASRIAARAQQQQLAGIGKPLAVRWQHRHRPFRTIDAQPTTWVGN
jgi:hypothetical protein